MGEYMDSFVAEIDDKFARGLYPLPLDNTWTVEDLRDAMIDAVWTNPKLSESQKLHTIANILETKEFDIVKAVWEGSQYYHVFRLARLLNKPRLSDTTENLIRNRMFVDVLEQVKPETTIDKLIDMGLTENNIRELEMDKLIVRVGNTVRLTNFGRRILGGFEEEMI